VTMTPEDFAAGMTPEATLANAPVAREMCDMLAHDGSPELVDEIGRRLDRMFLHTREIRGWTGEPIVEGTALADWKCGWGVRVVGAWMDAGLLPSKLGVTLVESVGLYDDPDWSNMEHRCAECDSILIHQEQILHHSDGRVGHLHCVMDAAADSKSG
jgi:hypothetical protein